MHLEDGRFLCSPTRYDMLLRQFGQDSMSKDTSLVRVHENFRVIALGVPVPPFPGNPLDPPLRSRFQARHIGRTPTPPLLATLRSQTQAGDQRVAALLSFYEAVWELGSSQGGVSGAEAKQLAFQQLHYPGELAILKAAFLLTRFPALSAMDAVTRMYPFRHSLLDEDSRKMVESLFASLGLMQTAGRATGTYSLESVVEMTDAASGPAKVFQLFFSSTDPPSAVQVNCVGGTDFFQEGNRLSVMDGTTMLDWHRNLLVDMLQSHSIGKDICVLGPRGEGKSFLVHKFARLLGYAPVESIFLYADMTARDLLQTRTTNQLGETVWKRSPLVDAALDGRLAILDGLDRLSMGTIAILVRLVEDRELTLFDGTRLVGAERYKWMQQSLGLSEVQLREEKKVLRIHPHFRVLATACPPTRDNQWLTNEIVHMFHFFALPALQTKVVLAESIDVDPRLANLLSTIIPKAPLALCQAIARLGLALGQVGADNDPSRAVASGGGGGGTSADHLRLSLRQMIRVLRRSVLYPEETHSTVCQALMVHIYYTYVVCLCIIPM
jgi:MoxR-like ATPase